MAILSRCVPLLPLLMKLPLTPCAGLIQIVFDDDHQSMVVKDKEEFDKVISVSWLPADGEWSSAELEQCVPVFLSFLRRVVD